ncbi:tyrosine-protein phosphatase non-receptor type 9-like [Tubulanus polymorphus]|uniref:tyrosine-protein phosphatase non-receptor type 9-like n=1 Tax=Tubulanus polymorphus TaxID=672921 RepID=UPI003DA608B0
MNLTMSAQLDAGEEEAVKDFIERVCGLQLAIHNGPVAWNTAVKFLMARKFDVNRAIELFIAHQETRQREGLVLIDPRDTRLHDELKTGKFTVLASRDNSGASIALFTACNHLPLQTTHQDTLKGLVIQLDTALESYETQRNGLVFIYDMTRSKYNNFDYDLSIKILNMLKGGYPARLKKVLIVTAPLWFRAPFKILRLFVREKLRDRVYTVSLNQLPVHIPKESLPVSLGGVLTSNHSEWARRCIQTMANQLETCTIPTDNNTQLATAASPGVETNPIISDMESEDSHETLPEKHNNEDREKEVEFEKDDVSKIKRAGNDQISSSTGNSLPCKRGSETAAAQCADQSKGTLPRKKHRPPSSAFEDSIHVADGGLTIQEFVNYCRSKRKVGFRVDYMGIKSEQPTGTFLEARKKHNASKNRYTDVLCMDESRVRLCGQDDYINANFLDGYKQKNAYINTQGPLPRTYPDFWQMIWEQQVLVIVMTTRTVERSRLKCGQYWPAEEDSDEELGDFVVINVGIEKNTDFIVTNLVLQNTKTAESREIIHLQFISWPDFGVPHSAKAFLQFLFRVREEQAQKVKRLGTAWTGHPLGPPMVVHCSAGIGRTGTFVTMDINMRRLADVGTVDVEKTVRRIRSQRAFSIQMPDQYVFCHTALIEHAQNVGLIADVNMDGFDESDQSD